MSTHAMFTIAITASASRAGPRRTRLGTWCWLLAACLLLSCSAAFAGKTRVVAWGGEPGNELLNIPYSLDDAVAISVPYVLRANGEVIEIGAMPPVTRAWNATAIAAAGSCLLILYRNGTVGAQGDAPSCQASLPVGLSGVVAIAGDADFGLALTRNGRVVAWGDNTSGQTDVPAGLANVVSIAAGRHHALALQSNGQVVAWGSNFDGALDIPPGLANVVAIDVGDYYNLALTSDGTVVAWGDIYDNPRPVPVDLPPVRALGAGKWRQAAVVLRDGAIREWGFQEGKSVPPGLSNVVTLSMGYAVNFALVARPITPGEAFADMRVDLAWLPAIEDSYRSALYADLDLAAWAVRANRRQLACMAMRSFAALAADPNAIPYPDRRPYFVAQARDVLRLIGCGQWS